MLYSVIGLKSLGIENGRLGSKVIFHLGFSVSFKHTKIFRHYLEANIIVNFSGPIASISFKKCPNCHDQNLYKDLN